MYLVSLRAKERLGKTLEDNALLNKEIDMLQRQLGTEKEEAVSCL